MNDDANDPKKPNRSVSYYKVGYGKPPQEYQFKPGKSGNSAGPPRSGVNDMDLYPSVNRTLKAKVSVNEHGKTRKVSALDATFMQQRQAALQCDKNARKELLKLLERADLARAAEKGEEKLEIIIHGGLPANDYEQAKAPKAHYEVMV